MRQHITIGLIGDRSDTVVAHRAIAVALPMAAQALGVAVDAQWVPTEEVTSEARISKFDGLWCVPASPYRSMEGALLAIRFAREQRRPFLGTCGGFQHAMLEYARNVLHWSEAAHAESSPEAALAVITPLACGMLSEIGAVRLLAGTRLAAAYTGSEAAEEYQCSYGVNPQFRAALLAGPLREAATDANGDLRGVELDGHPFFVATLFQPERAALHGRLPPLVVSFVRACSEI